MISKIENNEELLKKFVSAFDKLGKKYERMKRYIEIMHKLEKHNLPQILNDLGDDSRCFVHQSCKNQLAGIIKEHRFEMLDLIEFVEKMDSEGDEE